MSMTFNATYESLLYFFTQQGMPNTRPTSWTVQLFTGDPGPACTANQVNDGAYAPQAATFVVSTPEPPVVPAATNDTAIVFPAALAAYTVTHVVIRSNSNTPLLVQRLVVDKTIAIGDQAQFAIGELIIGGRI